MAALVPYSVSFVTISLRVKLAYFRLHYFGLLMPILHGFCIAAIFRYTNTRASLEKFMYFQQKDARLS